MVAPNRSRYCPPYRRSTSATVGMGLWFHQLVDHGDRLLLADGGEMEVDHRRWQRAVAQVLLDQPQVDASLQKMGGVAVPQRVDRQRLAPAQLLHHPLHRMLYTVLRHGAVGGHSLAWVAADVREQPNRVAVSHPVFAEQGQSAGRQWHEAILGALATMDVHQHPCTVNVADL